MSIYSYYAGYITMLRIAKEALTFDDVLLLPAYSAVLPSSVDLSTQLTQNIRLNIPILSAAMDTVTESNLAIALAKTGGIGFIHKNMSIERQTREVRKVKKYQINNISNLETLSPTASINEARLLLKRSKFTICPVIDNDNNLVGIVTNDTVKSTINLTHSISKIMIPKVNLLTVTDGESRDLVLKKMNSRRLKEILVVDNNNKLVKIFSINDFKYYEYKSRACIDVQGRLRVGAAIGIDSDYEERIASLISEDIDVILIDSSHGHSETILQSIRNIKSKYSNLELIGGNIATGSGALALMEAGANAIKVGIGSGSICTTRIVTGVGVPQITAISDAVTALEGTNVPIIADGGIRSSGDIAKAIAAGASSVMIGSILASAKESPSKIESYKGHVIKSYRGMGSLKAMIKGSSSRYFQYKGTSGKFVPEGIEGYVKYQGCVKKIIYRYMGGLRSCMGLTGCKTIDELRTKTKFVRISHASLLESHVHSVFPNKESLNNL